MSTGRIVVVIGALLVSGSACHSKRHVADAGPPPRTVAPPAVAAAKDGCEPWDPSGPFGPKQACEALVAYARTHDPNEPGGYIEPATAASERSSHLWHERLVRLQRLLSKATCGDVTFEKGGPGGFDPGIHARVLVSDGKQARAIRFTYFCRPPWHFDAGRYMVYPDASRVKPKAR